MGANSLTVVMKGVPSWLGPTSSFIALIIEAVLPPIEQKTTSTFICRSCFSLPGMPWSPLGWLSFTPPLYLAPCDGASAMKKSTCTHVGSSPQSPSGSRESLGIH